MFLHALRLTWNRKRSNALIIVELALAFLIVFFIAGVSSHMVYRWNLPLGFEWQNTLELQPQTGGKWTEEDGVILKNLVATVRDQPEIEWAHFSLPLFRGWTWSSMARANERELHINLNRMTDGGPEDFGVELLEGRFFNAADASPGVYPVLVNEMVVEELFPDGFVPGADIHGPEEDGEQRTTWPVIGVFRSFRQHGELSPVKPYVITRFPVEDLELSTPSIQVRLQEGTPIEFEEKLQALIESEAPTWSFSITPLGKLRDRQIREVIVPMAIAFWVSIFMLLMVGFGLFGVLWQSVTRRTDELGLRRALGAHRVRVYRLIVVETLILAALASVLGSLIAVQFPIAGGFEALDWRSSGAGLGVGFASILGLAGLCSLYPAWLASRRSPAEALHYE